MPKERTFLRSVASKLGRLLWALQTRWLISWYYNGKSSSKLVVCKSCLNPAAQTSIDGIQVYCCHVCEKRITDSQEVIKTLKVAGMHVSMKKEKGKSRLQKLLIVPACLLKAVAIVMVGVVLLGLYQNIHTRCFCGDLDSVNINPGKCRSYSGNSTAAKEGKCDGKCKANSDVHICESLEKIGVFILLIIFLVCWVFFMKMRTLEQILLSLIASGLKRKLRRTIVIMSIVTSSWVAVTLSTLPFVKYMPINKLRYHGFVLLLNSENKLSLFIAIIMNVYASLFSLIMTSKVLWSQRVAVKKPSFGNQLKDTGVQYLSVTPYPPAYTQQADISELSQKPAELKVDKSKVITVTRFSC